MYPLPDDCKIVPANLGYFNTDSGDHFVSFRLDSDEDMKQAADGIVAGFVVPKSCSRALNQLSVN